MVTCDKCNASTKLCNNCDLQYPQYKCNCSSPASSYASPASNSYASPPATSNSSKKAVEKCHESLKRLRAKGNAEVAVESKCEQIVPSGDNQDPDLELAITASMQNVILTPPPQANKIELSFEGYCFKKIVLMLNNMQNDKICCASLRHFVEEFESKWDGWMNMHCTSQETLREFDAKIQDFNMKLQTFPDCEVWPSWETLLLYLTNNEIAEVKNLLAIKEQLSSCSPSVPKKHKPSFVQQISRPKIAPSAFIPAWYTGPTESKNNVNIEYASSNQEQDEELAIALSLSQSGQPEFDAQTRRELDLSIFSYNLKLQAKESRLIKGIAKTLQTILTNKQYCKKLRNTIEEFKTGRDSFQDGSYSEKVTQEIIMVFESKIKELSCQLNSMPDDEKEWDCWLHFLRYFNHEELDLVHDMLFF